MKKILTFLLSIIIVFSFNISIVLGIFDAREAATQLINNHPNLSIEKWGKILEIQNKYTSWNEYKNLNQSLKKEIDHLMNEFFTTIKIKVGFRCYTGVGKEICAYVGVQDNNNRIYCGSANFLTYSSKKEIVNAGQCNNSTPSEINLVTKNNKKMWKWYCIIPEEGKKEEDFQKAECWADFKETNNQTQTQTQTESTIPNLACYAKSNKMYYRGGGNGLVRDVSTAYSMSYTIGKQYACTKDHVIYIKYDKKGIWEIDKMYEGRIGCTCKDNQVESFKADCYSKDGNMKNWYNGKITLIKGFDYACKNGKAYKKVDDFTWKPTFLINGKSNSCHCSQNIKEEAKIDCTASSLMMRVKLNNSGWQIKNDGNGKYYNCSKNGVIGYYDRLGYYKIESGQCKCVKTVIENCSELSGKMWVKQNSGWQKKIHSGNKYYYCNEIDGTIISSKNLFWQVESGQCKCSDKNPNSSNTQTKLITPACTTNTNESKKVLYQNGSVPIGYGAILGCSKEQNGDFMFKNNQGNWENYKKGYLKDAKCKCGDPNSVTKTPDFACYAKEGIMKSINGDKINAYDSRGERACTKEGLFYIKSNKTGKWENASVGFWKNARCKCEN